MGGAFGRDDMSVLGNGGLIVMQSPQDHSLWCGAVSGTPKFVWIGLAKGKPLPTPIRVKLIVLILGCQIVFAVGRF